LFPKCHDRIVRLVGLNRQPAHAGRS
jgi:hypothetical protein